MALEQKKYWTFEEYQDRPDELVFCELWNGELVREPGGSWRHQELTGAIFNKISNYLDQHPVGKVLIPPFDVRLNPAEAKAFHPDVLFVSRERVTILTGRSVQGAPDLIVEVLSPGTATYDLTKKKGAYEAGGVKEYWVVWQDLPRIEVYRLDNRGRYGKPEFLEAGDTLTTALLPDFTLELDRLYADLPPQAE